MRKSFFALAALNALCASAYAQASVTLYGTLDAGFGYVSNQRVAQTSGAAGQPIVYGGHSHRAAIGGTTTGNNWGLKGSEALSPDLSAIFQLESGFNIYNGQLGYGGRIFGRLSYVGLSSKEFGNLTLGRQQDPLTAYVASIGPGSFTTGVTAHPGDHDNVDGQSRESNSILYKSPSISGFQFGAMYGFGEQPGGMKGQSMWSLASQYANGPLAIGVGYIEANNTAGDNKGGWTSAYDGTLSSSVTEGFKSSKNIRIFGAATRYTMGQTTLGASYGHTQYTPGSFSTFSGKQAFNAITLNAGYQATPALRLGVGYGYARGDSILGAGAPRYHTFGAASFYSLSKRTTLYALAGYQKAAGATLDRFGNLVDATATIGDTTNCCSSSGQTQTVVRAGIRHSF